MRFLRWTTVLAVASVFAAPVAPASAAPVVPAGVTAGVAVFDRQTGTFTEQLTARESRRGGGERPPRASAQR
jgi:hypothetical protein